MRNRQHPWVGSGSGRAHTAGAAGTRVCAKVSEKSPKMYTKMSTIAKIEVVVETSTVRVSAKFRDELRDFARVKNESMTSVLEKALDAYKRQDFYQRLDAAYERLWSDPSAALEEYEERRLFEGALLDDLQQP